MGNCFARTSPLVHPSEPNHSTHVPNDRTRSPGALRIKVRMTARELKELFAEADLGKGDSEIGQLIVRECLQGKCRARVIGRVESSNQYRGKVRSLESLDTILEEEN